MHEVKIEQLWLYPVKSLAGIALAHSTATNSGFNFDRHWVVIKQNKQMLTQRQAPQMSQILPHIENRVLHLSHRDLGTIKVDEYAPGEIEVSIWKDRCYGLVASDAVNQWLTSALAFNEPLRLVRLSPKSQREFFDKKRFSVRANNFSDAAPFLIANQSSLNALEAAVSEMSLDIRRFRANIVISGLPAFTEHNYQWMGVNTNSKLFELIDPCSRCAMITIDPDSGKKDPQTRPFKELAGINNLPESTLTPAFGVNSVLRNASSFPLKVGDTLIIH